ncbi:hypothetical protein BH09GEM1_BH09GEM1_38360 [soil metagenome]
MADAPLLPELARSLRSLGHQPNAATQAAHAAIFTPLLDARTHAAGASADVVLAALRGAALIARIEANAVDAAVQGIEELPRVRALTAQTSELTAPLRAALVALDELAPAAAEDAAGWDAWITQLRTAFAAADTACSALAMLITHRNEQAATPRWFERLAR